MILCAWSLRTINIYRNFTVVINNCYTYANYFSPREGVVLHIPYL